MDLQDALYLIIRKYNIIVIDYNNNVIFPFLNALHRYIPLNFRIVLPEAL